MSMRVARQLIELWIATSMLAIWVHLTGNLNSFESVLNLSGPLFGIFAYRIYSRAYGYTFQTRKYKNTRSLIASELVKLQRPGGALRKPR